MSDQTQGQQGGQQGGQQQQGQQQGGQQQNAAPWYGDKIGADVTGWWQTKGIDPADPVAVASKLTEQYRNAEKLIGVNPEELVRLPKPNAAEADLKAFLGRIGVPAEAKDYDFSAVKFADGTDLDTGFADTMRAALLSARTPKDRAPDVVKAIVKFMEGNDAAEAADVTAKMQAERAALDKNWGANKPANMVIAQAALEKLGQRAGMTLEQAKTAWDALSNIGGIGASAAMEMLRVAGATMGEDRFIGGGQLGGSQAMSQAQAVAEIEALKKDTQFYNRLMAKDLESTKKWNDLHKVAYPRAA